MLIPNAVSAEFFHSDAGTAFVDLLINGNRETWPIRSKRFRNWLRRRTKIGGPQFWSTVDKSLDDLADRYRKSAMPEEKRQKILSNIRVIRDRWWPFIAEAMRAGR